MRNLMRKGLLVLSAVFCSFAFADDLPQEKQDQGHGLPDNQMMQAYNATARYAVNSSLDICFTTSFLYWQAKQDNLDVGFSVFPDPTENQGILYPMDMGFKPAFKVGLGVNLDYDNWDLFCEYLRMHGHYRHTVNKPEDATLHSLWRAVEFPRRHITAHWFLSLDLLDLYLNRPCYLGTKFTISPFAGFYGGRLNQKYESYGRHLHQPVTDDVRNKSKSWLIGPHIGMKASWHLGEGFRIFTNFSATMFYQHFRTTLKKHNFETHTLRRFVRDNNIDKKSQITPAIDLALGIAWGRYLANNDWHIDLLAGYEFYHFWNQNVMRCLFDSIIHHRIISPADLVIQGLTITLRLDF